MPTIIVRLLQWLQLFRQNLLDLKPAYCKTQTHTKKNKSIFTSFKLLGLGVLKKFEKKWSVFTAMEDIIYIKIFWAVLTRMINIWACTLAACNKRKQQYVGSTLIQIT